MSDFVENWEYRKISFHVAKEDALQDILDGVPYTGTYAGYDMKGLLFSRAVKRAGEFVQDFEQDITKGAGWTKRNNGLLLHHYLNFIQVYQEIYLAERG